MRKYLTLLCAALPAITAACSAGEAPPEPTGGSGGAHAGGGTGAEASAPDAAVGAPPVTPTGAFVISHLYLGDTDFDDAPCKDLSCWKHIGMNLDSQASDLGSSHCSLYGGAKPENIKIDGDDGIDNSFGKNIVSLTQKFLSGFSKPINHAIEAEGKTTLLVRTNLLDPSFKSGNVDAYVYRTAPLHALPPRLDGTDRYPIDARSLVSAAATLDDAIARDPGAKLTGDTLSIAVDALPMWLEAESAGVAYIFDFTLHHAQIEMTLSADLSRAKGTIAGVLDAKEFICALHTMLNNAKIGCITTADETILEAQDIIYTGGLITNTPGADCNAISFGARFLAVSAGYEGIEAPADLMVCPECAEMN